MKGLSVGCIVSVITVLAVSLSAAEIPSLKDLAAAKGKYFGCAFDPNEISNTDFANLMIKHCSVTTPGNQLKWDATEPIQGTFNFTQAERVIKFADDNKMKTRGHTLLWHSQLPNWLTSGNWTRESLTRVLENHIANVAGHYKGRLIHWDVVNEIFNDTDGSFRDTIWYRTLGEDFVSIAFHAARKADPAAKLYINDYDNQYTSHVKYKSAYNLVKKLKSQGVPVDGIGIQAHLSLSEQPEFHTFFKVMEDYASLGVDIAITEFDIRGPTPFSEKDLEIQKEGYRTIVTGCLATKRCVGIETWGLADLYTWVPYAFPGLGEPLPFDKNLQPKPAFNGMLEAFGVPPVKLPTPNATTTANITTFAITGTAVLTKSATTRTTNITPKPTVTINPSPPAVCTPLPVHKFDSINNLLGGDAGTGGTGKYSVKNGVATWTPAVDGYFYTNLYRESVPSVSQCRSLKGYSSLSINLKRTDSAAVTSIQIGLDLGCGTSFKFTSLGTAKVDGTNKIFTIPISKLDLSKVKAVVLVNKGVKSMILLDNIEFKC
ncbi:hypothetical protein HK098_004696 [Nowakowskiella sp. JEL0407]|nr:hypothetical protein HK098_004696 [Nowakowskiella sp. JEL0407]